MTGDDRSDRSVSDDELRTRWLEAVDRVLGGRAFEEVLLTHTRSGLGIEPLYTAAAGAPAPALPGTGDQVRGAVRLERLDRGWDVRQRHGPGDPTDVNHAILEDLERGVTSVELAAHRADRGAPWMRAALEGVILEIAPVALAPHADPAWAAALVDRWSESDTDPDTGGGLGLDPIGELSRSGEVGVTAAEAAALVVDRLEPRPRVHGFCVDAHPYVDAGATERQELAWGVATGVSYLRAMVDAGLDPTDAGRRIAFRWSATAEQFVTIAKLRAARRMWARVLDMCRVAEPDRVQYQHAATPTTMYSRRDPLVNSIRATTAALAAVAGGADAVTVLPHDVLLDSPDRLGRRMARNTQILLLEESHLGRTVDPGGGSWFVESLTDRLATGAWDLLRSVERAGGMIAQLESGEIGRQVDASWARRMEALATRSESLTGVNRYPELADTGGGGGEAAVGRRGLPVRRPAQPFEELRDAADRHLGIHGVRPFVHLAALGPLADHGARSTWVSNLLAVGGIAAVGADGDGSDSPIAAEAAFAGSGASIAVICGSDQMVASRGLATAVALREAGAELVVVAGRLADMVDELSKGGVAEFWSDGIDVLDTLQRLHARLDIST